MRVLSWVFFAVTAASGACAFGALLNGDITATLAMSTLSLVDYLAATA